VHPNLLAWAQDLDHLERWRENGFIAWRALSGVFAANEVRAVSFSVGSEFWREIRTLIPPPETLSLIFYAACRHGRRK